MTRPMHRRRRAGRAGPSPPCRTDGLDTELADCGYPLDECDCFNDDDDDYPCGYCCGDGAVENDDPIQQWDSAGEGYIKCPSCHGSGKRKDMTLW